MNTAKTNFNPIDGAAAATTTSEESPYPPRFWWLKRIALAWVVLVLLLLGLRLWWGWAAKRQYLDLIATAETKGFIFEASAGSLPDAENAVDLLAKAGEQLDPNWFTEIINAALNDSALTKDQLHSMSQVRKSAEASMRLVEEAKQASAVDWGPTPRGVGMRNLGVFRNLSKFLIASARCSYESGEHSLAFGALEDAHYVADTVARNPSLIGHLVAIAMYAIECAQIERMASELCVDSSAPGDCPAEERVREHIARLVDGSLQDSATAA